MKARPDSSRTRIPARSRKRLVWGLWFVTWIGLVIGLFEPVFFEYVVYLSALHALLVMALLRFRIGEFSVQVRIGYLLWVLVGTYVPGMVFLMYITTVGLATNLFLGYCPLARLLYLLPWNREESFSLDLVARVVISPPSQGPFLPIGGSVYSEARETNP